MFVSLGSIASSGSVPRTEAADDCGAVEDCDTESGMLLGKGVVGSIESNLQTGHDTELDPQIRRREGDFFLKCEPEQRQRLLCSRSLLFSAHSFTKRLPCTRPPRLPKA